MSEVFLEVLEDEVDDFGLLLWRELLIEVELFNDQVVVVFKGLLDGLTDRQVKVTWDEQRSDRRVCLLQLFDPNV